MPRDRWQSVAELAMGHHPEVDQHFAHLRRDYDSIVISKHVLATNDPITRRIGKVLTEHFDLVLTARSASAQGVQLYRRKPAPR